MALYNRGVIMDRYDQTKILRSNLIVLYLKVAGGILLRNTGKHVPDYTVSHSR
jgi:hypothetical protein